jgi:hypothetical protein
MRVTIILILTFFPLIASGQNWTGKYQDYFGRTLILNKDSTFRFDWRFDLIYEWASGQWTVSGRTVNLNFISVYDTLSRPHRPDSLVLSIDEKSNKVNAEEFGQSVLLSGGQYKDRFSDRLYKKGNRLFLTKNGRPYKSRHRGIWTQKKWWGYKRWPTFYKKED